MSTATAPLAQTSGAGATDARNIALFVLRRLASAAVVVVVVSIVVFAFVHAAPGGPEQSIGGQFATPDQLAAIRAEHRLDEPIFTQYGYFLAAASQLDFGTSYSTREPVMVTIARGAGTTVPLVLAGWGAALLIGTALGVASARRAGGVFDRSVLGLTMIGASSPVFASAILLSFVFGVQLGWFPTLGAGQGGMDRLLHLALPVLTLTIAALAAISKVTKVRVQQVLDEDYVTFATARGLPPMRILWGVVLRNSGVQLLTQGGAVLVALISAVILVEEVYDLDGLGALLLQAIAARDIPLIQAITLITSIFIVLVNLAVDLVCLGIDPRLRAALGGDK